MDLEKRYVTLTRQNGKAVSQMTLEADQNVPDQKPDIFRVIHRQGEFQEEELKGEAGKVRVRGIFLYRILYLAEDTARSPQLLEGSIPVDETVFVNGMEEGDALDFRWELEDLYASAIHSRKANVKGVLSLSVESYREQPVPLVDTPSEETDLEIRTCPVQLQQELLHKKDTMRIREEINLPPGRPNIRQLIWKEMRLQGTEVRQEEGKILVKGELDIFFLYESEEDGRIQWMEQSVPFRNEVDCENCRPDLSGKTEVSLQKWEMDLQPDYDGEPRMVRVDASLKLLLKYYEEQSADILCDAYSLSREILPKQKTYAWNQMQQSTDSRARIAGRMKLSENDAPVLQILSSSVRLHLEHGEMTDAGLLLQGNVELMVLYTTSDDTMPLACVENPFPFEHTVEVQNTEIGNDWQVVLSLDQLMVSMLDERELEMKGALQIQVLFWNPQNLTVVEELEEQPLDMERIKQMPGMVIHVVQPGENLWEIAKTHATTCRLAANLNELKEEEVTPGQKILLVKEVVGRR
jgi:hypothetical protein